jgi:hypothetical protein
MGQLAIGLYYCGGKLQVNFTEILAKVLIVKGIIGEVTKCYKERTKQRLDILGIKKLRYMDGQGRVGTVESQLSMHVFKQRGLVKA